MILLDTNIFLRFLTADLPERHASCRELFRRIESGETATTIEAVLTEVVYVLGSKRHYNLSQAAIAGILTPIVALP
jgi:predicted nucleic acid-binding protein